MNGNDGNVFQPELGNIEKENNMTSSSEQLAVEPLSFDALQDDNSALLATYSCPVCNMVYSTRIEANKNSCAYCGAKGASSVEDSLIEDAYIIPFTCTMKDAISAYKKTIRFNPVVPLSYRTGRLMKKIKKVYLACSLYDFGVGGNVIFTGADRIKKISGVPMQTFECMFSTNFEFNNILSSNNFKIGDEILCSINHYNYSVMKEFSFAIMNDAYLIHGNIEMNDIMSRNKENVGKHALSIVRGAVPHDLKKVSSNNMVVGVSSSKTVFVPLYILNTKYKNKRFFFYMNGQTGEVVSELPSSFISVIIFSIIVFSIVFTIVFFFARF